MYQIDLNSDLGESFGHYTIGNDDKIIPSSHQRMLHVVIMHPIQWL